MSHQDHVAHAQDISHAAGHDYDKGSPHLRHPQLRRMVDSRINRMVARQLAATGSCHVLEIGAGHGTFTDHLLAAGATVTVTETSRASANVLTERFAHDVRVTVVHDDTGESVFDTPGEWDAFVAISVLHHIPDYLGYLSRVAERIRPGGSMFSVQDPLYYPRTPTLTHRLDRGAYFLWRIGQGDMKRGLATRWRRLRGRYDESQPSDLVEYHVVRQGVDEKAIRDLLAPRFEDFELFTYWSTQSPLLQKFGEKTSHRTTFGFWAQSRRG